jgi:hypothetical protein
MTRRLAGWALVAFAVFYMLTSPDGAAGLVHGVLGGLEHAARSLSSFVSSL